MSDLISGKSDCNKCVWGTRDGGCASWDCGFIDRDEAVKAWRRLSSAEPKVLVGDLISREYMKSLGGACLAQRLKDGDLCPIISIDLLPSAEPERKTGKWIYNSPVTMKCDQCGFVIKDWDWHRFKYCPNCMAEMRGEQE